MKKNKVFAVHRFFWPIVVLAVVSAGAVWTNAVVFNHESAEFTPALSGQVPHSIQAPVLRGEQTASPDAAVRMQEGISHVAAMVRPSVVSVRAPFSGQAVQGSGLTYVAPHPGNSGLVGSGFIIDRRGYIITTFKTVGKATRVRVSLFSGNRKHYEADVIAVDPQTDLALLKILANDVFPAIILGNSDLVEIGDIVFAVGSPFGFSRTVTMGIVSSNRRNLSIDGTKYPDLIQTDAAINEGNDGGPLVNIRGEVIGVNMAYYRPNSRFSGIGFAVPINDVRNFVTRN